MLRPLTNVLNRNIAAITPARELCAELSGSVVAVRIDKTALQRYILVHDDVLEVVSSADREPDVVISGSLVSLARLAGPDSAALIRSGEINLSGDAETAQRLQRLLSLARPDIEEEFAGIVGDAVAHRVGDVVRGIRRWSQSARTTTASNIREYLQEESRDAPSRYEAQRSRAAIDRLRDDVDRLEARINHLLDKQT